MRLTSKNKTGIVCALGAAQTIAWASSYYLPAVLAIPMARDMKISPVWVFTAFSAAMVLSALAGPWSGARIDRLGGRETLMSSNLIFAVGLCLLGVSSGKFGLFAAWSLLGVGMGIGLYDSAFATLTAIHKHEARTSITGITLFAGFASTVGWPLSALMETQFGWRGACFGWAALHFCLALPLNALLPQGTHARAKPESTEKTTALTFGPESLQMVLLGFVFAITWFNSAAMAVHLPRLLEATGTTSVAAVAAGALIGPAQVGARIVEFTLLRKVNPLTSSRVAVLAHPLGAAILMIAGGPAAAIFTILHGGGNGILTIVKGTLPLTLFGPVGYGLRQGIISFPARVLQAFAPLLFGFVLELYGRNAIWLTCTLSILAFAALMVLRVSDKPEK